MRFRFKKIGLALSLMVSLVAGHASARCICSHHQLDQATETDCHSHHDSDASIESLKPAHAAAGPGCVCVVEASTPFASTRSAKKDLGSTDLGALGDCIFADIASAEATKLTTTPAGFENNFSYSYTLRSLLPSRAPPRL